MMVTSKRPRLPADQHQKGFMFNSSMCRTEHLQNTLDRKVFLLDGYGVLHTIARTTSVLPQNPEEGLSITTAINHNVVSDSVQIEDRPHLRSPDEIRSITQVSGGDAGCTLVMSQTVVFSKSELLENEVVYDKCSNYHVSLSRDALVKISEDRQSPTKLKTVKTDVDKCTLALNLVVVDNRVNAPQCYFVNVFNRVYEVPVTVNPEMEDGVWIDSNVNQTGGETVDFVSLQDSIYSEDRKGIPPVTLFTNALEAKRLGNENAVSKERERVYETELTHLKQALETAKADNALYKEKLDREALVRKDHYEERSVRRKDETESVGIVAKVIGGVVAVATAVVGLMRWLT